MDVSQQLPEEFRDHYSKFWMAIISRNLNAIQLHAEKLGVGELYGLFACMATGRSWNAIQGGIDRNPKNKEEEMEIKNDAAKYLVYTTLYKYLYRMMNKFCFKNLGGNHRSAFASSSTNVARF